MSKKIYKKVIDKVNKMTEKEIKESILAANPQLKKDINLVKLTDTHLSIINAALETYYRLKSGQISMALDIAYDYKLTYDQSHAIESIVKVMALPELAKNGCSYGFNSPEIGDGKIAFEIRKTFEEVLAWSKGSVIVDAEFKEVPVIIDALRLVKKYDAYDWLYFQVTTWEQYRVVRNLDARVAVQLVARQVIF